MFVMSFCKASTSSNSSTTSLMHEGLTEAKFRSRRLAIDITVTIVTGVAPPGSACLLLFSEGGEPAPYHARETTWSAAWVK